MVETTEKRDLVLPPGTYAYVQDETKGQIRTFVGPVVINQTGQDRPVKYDHSKREFRPVSLREAQEKMPLALEGDYIVLENPSGNKTHPQEGSPTAPPELKFGSKVNLPGPTTFALWPGQAASVIRGHNLRSNQYLVVRIYNEEEAKTNWASAVMKSVDVVAVEGEAKPLTAEKPNLTTGKLLNIKGTEVSFYIPPTGVEVVADSEGNYLREAETLEQMDYCVLVDENGRKRYERGPQVVFPQPTERFFIKDGSRKFRAYELTPISGIHIKVIAPYKEEDSTERKEGEELFLTGDTKHGGTAIYFPRPEHSIVQYGEKDKHYATAVPAGEGRYVMERLTGKIYTKIGPDMALLDPRFEVFVRRCLTDKAVQLWYPGNSEALAYNQNLRSLMQSQQGVRADFVEETMMNFSASPAMARKFSEGASAAAMADVFARSTTYTPPRTVTLDTKYDGVPRINVWTGYAVNVVSATGKRRVEVGPKTILLEYDETLEVLEMSTGKPKNTDKLERTVYLRVKNNKVSDIIQNVETRDHVPLTIKLAFRVDFDGDPDSWFSVENYVKLLCDHVRSMLKGYVRTLEVDNFYSNGVAMIRDFLLGKSENGSRIGLVFPENGMMVRDVEVLDIKIENEQIATMLKQAQQDVMAANIGLTKAEKQFAITKRTEVITREQLQEKATTAKLQADLETAKIADALSIALAEIGSKLQKATYQEEVTKQEELVKDVTHLAQMARQEAESKFKQSVAKETASLKILELQADTKSVTERFTAAQQGFSEALLALSNNDTLAKVVQAGSVQQIIGGPSLVEAIVKILAGTGLEDVGKKMIERGADRMSIPTAR